MKATLAGVDPDDLLAVQVRLETAFGIEFTDEEARTIHTFGHLCDVVSAKTQATDRTDCTSQQAFYKLRQSLTDTLRINRQLIQPATPLASLLPLEGRRAVVRQLEVQLNVPLPVLAPSQAVQFILLFLFSTSLLTCFFNPLYGLPGVFFSFSINWVANRFGRQLTVPTVGDLVHKLVREHYRAIRRNPNAVNQREIVAVISQLVYAELALDPGVLTPDASF